MRQQTLPIAVRGAGRPMTLALGLGLLLSTGAHAQSLPSPGAVLEQTRPAQAQPTAPGAVLTLPAPTQQKSGSTLLIPVSKLVIEGNSWLASAQLHKLVAPAEGHKLTLDALNGYVARITEAYHAAGYPVAYAYLPAQQVRNGVIRIAVVEPHYDQVTVSGESRFKPDQARATVGVKPGDPVVSKPLSRGLLLLQETPGVQVQGILLPGAQPVTTTLDLKRTDLPLVSGSTGLSNDGNQYTGKLLGNFNVTANDPFGMGSSLSANGLISQSGGLKAGGFAALSPDLGNGLRAGVYGSVTSYVLGQDFAALDQHGKARQAGVNLSYPLLLQTGRRLDLRLDLLKNWMSQDTRSTATQANQQVTLARLGLSGAISDAKGNVTSGRIAFSQGRLTLGPDAARVADAAGPNAAGDFSLLRFRLTRDQHLGQGFSLRADLSGQLASKNLDSSQKFYLGGPDGVMSASAGTGGGDVGVIMRLKLSHGLDQVTLPGRLDGAVLAQFGAVKLDHTRYAAGPEHLSGGAIGLGLDYTQGAFSVQAAVVAPAGGNGLATGRRIWLSSTLSF